MILYSNKKVNSFFEKKYHNMIMPQKIKKSTFDVNLAFLFIVLKDTLSKSVVVRVGVSPTRNKKRSIKTASFWNNANCQYTISVQDTYLTKGVIIGLIVDKVIVNGILIIVKTFLKFFYF